MLVRDILGKIPDILLAQLAAFSVAYGLTSSLVLNCTPLYVFLWCALFTTAIFVLFYNKTTTIASIMIFTVAFPAASAHVIFVKGLSGALNFLSDYFYWLGDFIQYPDVPDPLYQSVTVISLSILASFFFYIFIIKRFTFPVIAAAGIGLFATQWAYGIIGSMTPFYICLAVTLISYIRHVYHLKSDAASGSYAKPGIISAWGLPVCLIIIALAFSFHAGSKPIEWNWLDKKFASIYNYINRNFDYEAFDYFSLSASSGFGDRSNILGGKVRLDRTNVLQVTSPGNVYLRGSIRDEYTGSGWISDSKALSPLGRGYDPIFEEAREMLTGMELLTGSKDLKKYVSNSHISVIYLNIKTKSLFIPGKAKSFKPKTVLDAFSDNNGSISAGKRLAKGFSYNVDLYAPLIATEEFADIMMKSRRGLYAEYLSKNNFSDNFSASAVSSSAAAIAGNSVNTMNFASEKDMPEGLKTYQEILKLKEKSDAIYAKYLQLPANLPQRVRDLAASLVAGKRTNYEKAKAIEQYLSRNYPYNPDVRSTPRKRDFVDYFLFDLRQGYCSYYASAMAVLGRCVGLPTRYVEGYMLPPEPVKNSRSTYIVTNMQAHAWVEIYFEGFGWLPFEPTSPFAAGFYSLKQANAVIADSYSSAYEDYMEMMRRYANRNSVELSGINLAEEKTKSSLLAILIFGGIILIFSALFLFNAIRSRIKLYKIINLPAKNCILTFYDYYVNVLTMLGLGLESGETAGQYSGRIDAEIYFSPVRFSTITEIFMKARYSQKQSTEDEKQLFCDFHREFTNEIKFCMGKIKYFVYKFIYGKF